MKLILTFFLVSTYTLTSYGQSNEPVKRSDLTMKPLVIKTDKAVIDLKNIEEKLIDKQQEKGTKEQEAIEPKSINKINK